MKKNLLIIALLYASTAIAQIPIPTNGLVAYYHFNGNANDESGNGNNGSSVNLTDDRFGNPNSAMLATGYTEVPHSSSLTFPTNEISIAFWVKADVFPAPPNADNLITKGSYPSGFQIVQLAATSINGGTSAGCGASVPSNTSNYGVFHHVAMTFGNGFANSYLDGVQYNSVSAPCTIGATTSPLIFGNAVSGFSGVLDEIAIYNRVLTPMEVLMVMHECSVPAPTITAATPTVFCAGSNVLLTAPWGNATYQWTKGGVNISNAVSNTYTATIGGTYSCIVSCGTITDTSNSIPVTKLANAGSTVSAGGSTTFCAGGNVTLTATDPGTGYTYKWFRGNISINGATALSYVAGSPGSYKIITTKTSNNCSRISNVISTVVNCRLANPTVVAGSVEKENDLIVYPNPAAGSFTIQLNEETEGTAKIELINLSGQKIYETTYQVGEGEFEKTINFESNIPEGFYILRVKVKDRGYESKVVIN